MNNNKQGYTRSNREVYPLTYTTEEVLKDVIGRTQVFSFAGERGIDPVLEAIEYIGEMEHDPSLRGEYSDVRLNAVAGIITDFVRYLVLEAEGA